MDFKVVVLAVPVDIAQGQVENISRGLWFALCLLFFYPEVSVKYVSEHPLLPAAFLFRILHTLVKERLQ